MWACAREKKPRDSVITGSNMWTFYLLKLCQVLNVNIRKWISLFWQGEGREISLTTPEHGVLTKLCLWEKPWNQSLNCWINQGLSNLGGWESPPSSSVSFPRQENEILTCSLLYSPVPPQGGEHWETLWNKCSLKDLGPSQRIPEFSPSYHNSLPNYQRPTCSSHVYPVHYVWLSRKSYKTH